MKYWKTRQLSATEFKRLSGVKRKTFQVMVRVIKAEEKKKKKSGRPPELRIEEQILMTLQYLREYRTYYHIGTEWGISESAVCRIVQKIENLLIRSRKFSLPGKKELLKIPTEEKVVVMDVMESPIERPQKGQKAFFSGKQKEHTLKTQVIFYYSTKYFFKRSKEGLTHDDETLRCITPIAGRAPTVQFD